jgi:mono/diheme cytochrome c family protein
MFSASRISTFLGALFAILLLSYAHVAHANDDKIDPKRIFAANCSWCHGDYGRTAGKAPKLKGTQLTEKQVVQRIANGVSGKMPPYKRTLSEAEIHALAVFIKNLENE